MEGLVLFCPHDGGLFLLEDIFLDFIAQYRKKTKKSLLISVILIGLIIFCSFFFLNLGAVDVSASDIFKIVWGNIANDESLFSGMKKGTVSLVWHYRLPRIICAVLVGAGLSTAGCCFQSILSNPLADPYTLGISTGSAFGASIAIYLNVTYGSYLPVSLISLIAGFLTLITVIAISKRGNGRFSNNLIIAGIIMSAFLSSGTSFIKMMAGENVSAIVFWLMGSLSSKTWRDVMLLFPVIFISVVVCTFFSRSLNLMTFGEKDAEALGVNVKKMRLLYMCISSVITAVCVSTCGIIGFVGLIVPHMLRLIVGGDNRTLIPLSALLGSFLLLLADNVARLISQGEIPAGVITTLLGGPFFIWLFIRSGGNNVE